MKKMINKSWVTVNLTTILPKYCIDCGLKLKRFSNVKQLQDSKRNYENTDYKHIKCKRRINE